MIQELDNIIAGIPTKDKIKLIKQALKQKEMEIVNILISFDDITSEDVWKIQNHKI